MFFKRSFIVRKDTTYFLTGKMFNKNISKQKLFFRQITLNQFIIHASKDLITIYYLYKYVYRTSH